jgi:hypothetical protein
MQRKLNFFVKKFDNVHYKFGHVESFDNKDNDEESKTSACFYVGLFPCRPISSDFCRVISSKH